MTNQEQQGDSEPESTTFKWGFSLGKKPPEMVDSSPEEESQAESVASSEAKASIELAGGNLRIGSGDHTLLQLDLNSEPEQFAYRDPFPLVTSIRNWLHRLVIFIAAALPIAFVALCVATGQAADTTVFAGVFGLILSAMLISSVTPQRTVVSELLEDLLMDAARKHAHPPPEALPDATAAHSEQSATSETPSVFTIVCDNCGVSFPPVPPTAICPQCSTPALPR